MRDVKCPNGPCLSLLSIEFLTSIWPLHTTFLNVFVFKSKKPLLPSVFCFFQSAFQKCNWPVFCFFCNSRSKNWSVHSNSLQNLTFPALLPTVYLHVWSTTQIISKSFMILIFPYFSFFFTCTTTPNLLRLPGKVLNSLAFWAVCPSGLEEISSGYVWMVRNR